MTSLVSTLSEVIVEDNSERLEETGDALPVGVEHNRERSDEIGEPSKVIVEHKGERSKSADAIDGDTAVLDEFIKFCTE